MSETINPMPANWWPTAIALRAFDNAAGKVVGLEYIVTQAHYNKLPRCEIKETINAMCLSLWQAKELDRLRALTKPPAGKSTTGKAKKRAIPKLVK